MGNSQPLPLPLRVPIPTSQILNELKQVGVILNNDAISVSSRSTYKSNGQYVTYSLPTGWQMVNDSEREDIPWYYLLDQEKKKRFRIQGQWKGYDSDYLMWFIEENPKVYTRTSNTMEQSQTSDHALTLKLMEHLDPLKRSSFPLPNIPKNDNWVDGSTPSASSSSSSSSSLSSASNDA